MKLKGDLSRFMLTAADTHVAPGVSYQASSRARSANRLCPHGTAPWLAMTTTDHTHTKRAETRCRRVTPLEPLMNAFHTIVAAVAPAPMRNARRAVKTSGIVTKGTCAKICTHHRKPSVGNLPVARGMTASDITSQMRGP